MRQTEQTLNGAGPWLFSDGYIKELEPMESDRINLNNVRYNNTGSFFAPYLPITNLSVTNESTTNPLLVTVNGAFELRVGPNSNEGVSKADVTSLTLQNIGASTLESGKITVELSEDAYDADEAAREEKSTPLLGRVVKDVVPGL